MVRYKKKFLEKLPIPQPDNDDEKDIVEAIEEIINIAEQNDYPSNKEKTRLVKEFEELINDYIYKLYGFSELEINYVQNSILKQ